MRILVADDEVLLIELTRHMLSDYDVITAMNGIEAVERYKEYTPDMVLMDIRMPLMDGIEATKEIMKIDPNAKILAVTACAHIRAKEILDVGVLEIIKKPFDLQYLINTIKKYLLVGARVREIGVSS